MKTTELRCDNYELCRSFIPDYGDERKALMRARVGGWHVWDGETMSGSIVVVRLCKRCFGSRRRDLDPAPPGLSGQQELF